MSHEPRSNTLSRRNFLLAAGTATLATALRPAMGADSSPEEQGYESLFNGVDLEGWHCGHGSHGEGGRWLVEDGVLTGEQEPPGSGNGGLLLSDRKFGDFELILDMRPDWGPDTGVFFRCTDQCAGFQMYVDYHDRGNVGHLRGEMPGAFAMKPFQIFAKLDAAGRPVGFTTGPDPRAVKWPEGVYEYVCTPDDWLKVWRPGGWNTAKIRCVGRYPAITTWINGLRMCHFDSQTTTFPGHDKEHVFELLGRAGSIGFQVHGGQAWPNGAKCRWKNIRIKEL